MTIEKYQKINLYNYNSYTSYDVDYIKDDIIYVKNNNQYSFISIKSKNISNHDNQLSWYKSIECFKNGQAVVCFDDNKYGVIDEESNLLNGTYYNKVERINDQYYQIREESNDGVMNYGVMDKSGKIIITMSEYHPEYQKDGNFVLHKSFTGCRLFNMKKGKITAQYLKIEPLNNNLYKARKELNFSLSYKSKMGVIDDNNNIIIPFEYQKIIYVNDKVLLVDDGKKYKYIDYHNKELKDISKNIKNNHYYFVINYTYGHAIAGNGYEKVIIDESGNKVSDVYDGLSFVKDDLAIASDWLGQKLIDFNNQMITEKYYRRIDDFYYGVAIFYDNGDYGLINDEGKELISGCKDIQFISENVAKIMINDCVCLSNLKGKIFYTLKDKATQVSEKDGLIIIVDKDNQNNIITKVINLDGKELVQPIRNQQVSIYDQETLCVEGCLIDINHFEYLFCVDIKDDLKLTTRKFDNAYKMNLFVNYLTDYINQNIDTFYDKVNKDSLNASSLKSDDKKYIYYI